ncbi:glycerophosphodiester phosphodiesterase family protein [Mucilaginibacter myungsuensis]|uniref:Glycerophosphodiester phosphodiesterase n=1 Tax=Mucilaginibacter myungsuensis TaxID=649104 RepID=A0A929L5J0_9SPHI|nr:glycerophosphodiester phosphodiesterase family protein [Mucilaginibacter myungsuensis]MBE9664380.1 glycerophosphodiester phosphodiesterase [Mucilaginibacter myungsuensis]MDN3597090.1 glycerophosphodiester phosphodiesterase family protein [Mucilaginibacter myungsuensis]
MMNKLKYTGMVLSLLGITFISLNFKTLDKVKGYPFLKIGHRGTRGMMPENTIPSMTKAVEFGSNVVELDVHISKDGQVVVYHDDSFDPNYTLMPDGSEIDPKTRNNYIFYQMNYADIKPFVIGTKKYKPYPLQQNVATYTPLLAELVDSVDRYTKVNKLPKVYYLVEIKADEKKDGINQPAPAEFVKRVMDALAPKKLGDRLIIQSFDKRQLKEVHKSYPKVATGFLIGDAKISVSQHLADMGFTPTFYNPHYSVITAEFMKECHDKKMLVCPWTVNDKADMKRMLNLKVDGVITDFPNYLSEVLK